MKPGRSAERQVAAVGGFIQSNSPSAGKSGITSVWSEPSARIRYMPVEPSRRLRKAISVPPSTHTGFQLSPSVLSGAMPEPSEEHTSELKSRFELVCRLLLEKKNIK